MEKQMVAANGLTNKNEQYQKWRTTMEILHAL